MQEDIENKTVMLMINGSKFSARKLALAASKMLSYMKNHAHKDVTKHGKLNDFPDIRNIAKYARH